MKNKIYDVIIIGAGAAGYMSALSAIQNNKSVLVIDSFSMPLRKVKIAGGGRCNFTNLDMSFEHYHSVNPHFVKSALNQFKVSDFLLEMDKNNIQYYEKKLGQIFCKNKSIDIINYLMKETEQCEFLFDTDIKSLIKNGDLFSIKTGSDIFHSHSVIIATGGISYKYLGVSSFALTIAKQFLIDYTDFQPALVPFQLSSPYPELAGISIPCAVSIGKKSFDDDMLFTHKGLSGPAILKISNFWNRGDSITLNFLPNDDISKIIIRKKEANIKITTVALLKEYFPLSFVNWIMDNSKTPSNNIQELSKLQIINLVNCIHKFTVKPLDDMGFDMAEISKGGIDTSELLSKTFEAKKVKGLYFVGECVDISGDLGGYNIWFAFASGWIAGKNA